MSKRSLLCNIQPNIIYKNDSLIQVGGFSHGNPVNMHQINVPDHLLTGNDLLRLTVQARVSRSAGTQARLSINVDSEDIDNTDGSRIGLISYLSTNVGTTFREVIQCFNSLGYLKQNGNGLNIPSFGTNSLIPASGAGVVQSLTRGFDINFMYQCDSNLNYGYIDSILLEHFPCKR